MSGLTGDWKRLQELRDGKEPAATEPEEPAVRPGGGEEQEKPPAPRKSRAGRTRGGRRPPPAAADAIPTTVRFDPEESVELDFFVLELRDDAGRRSLDKAEVIREVLRLAREHEPTKKALLKRLR